MFSKTFRLLGKINVKKKRYFIARKYCNQPSGSQSYYEESIFDTYEAAYQFVEEISEEDDDCFLSEIVSYLLNDTQSWENEQSWTFDRKAKLIRYYDSKKMEENSRVEYHDGYKTIFQEPEPNSYQNKYDIGEIVLVKGVEKYLPKSDFRYPKLNNQHFFRLRFLPCA